MDKVDVAALITDEMIAAFGEAWQATSEGQPGARRRAGLVAALAVAPWIAAAEVKEDSATE